ncbi:MAG: N-6 DNA methylase [Chloracidobacterium sp.]|nr:N-6 DNA methylase [Chloracidobacterium sp.]MDW8217517.1 type ISP restriction/modification enzyme [Acidobacteriota bacterium]
MSLDPVVTYFCDLGEIRRSGAATPEMSFYPALKRLLDAVGATLRPQVQCLLHPKGGESGLPDGGLFTVDQLPQETPPTDLRAVSPARGVIEVKSADQDIADVIESEQVRRYVAAYGQVLATTLREFATVGRDADGRPQVYESYRLAEREDAFWRGVAAPDAFAEKHSAPLTEFLRRALLAAVPLTNPADVAWFLASYARDARTRVAAAQSPALQTALAELRTALEETLGIRFDAQRGDRFFRSTLVQTLFYGVFAAWVLWHHERPERADRFDWRTATFYLHVPVLQALFSRLALPLRLQPLGLMTPLDRAGDLLNRVDRAAFFQRFDTGQAVQYFYEPFLEAFDPQLRRELGVWYTPPEVVRYMVARVDAVLRDELGVADGLADPNVYVLDPCTGTGAYLVETLRVIEATLRRRAADALLGQDIKRAALTRIVGFELLPAPFVIAHLQIGLLLQQLGAPLAEQERVGVYLTNALTGWLAADNNGKPVQLPLSGLPELAQERDAAGHVKRNAPILVVLGNPPYSGYAGIARMDEERDLSLAYRLTHRAPKPQGQGLNDLYVRFFRMAERQVVERSQRGVVCFITNYAWLDGRSHTGMRERYFEVFDRIWIDSLNGDKYRTGKTTPDGRPDPSVFSTELNPEGIQVGTAITLLVRRQRGASHRKPARVAFRDFWGQSKRADLLAALNHPRRHPYRTLTPPLSLGLPFSPAQVSRDYLSWPRLPDLLPTSFPGVKTSRDEALVDVDRERLIERMRKYFDPTIGDDAIKKLAPSLMQETARFDPIETRRFLRQRGFREEHVRRYCYRPFDVRWLYWEPETKLLDEKRAEYVPHIFEGNVWLAAAQHNRRAFDPPPVTANLASLHLIERGANLFPLYLRANGQQNGMFEANANRRLNLSPAALKRLRDIEAVDEADALFHHIVAVLHAPAYRSENAAALRRDWPRVPWPTTREALLNSAQLGRRVAALLDGERPVPGVTTGDIDASLRSIAVLSVTDGGTINPAAGDLDVTAGWGYAGRGGVVMPGKGRIIERVAQASEINRALGIDGGGATLDVHLNARVYWRNVPPRVWAYTVGGYQVLKKWLSYREKPILGRGLTIDEAREVTAVARRIAALLLLSEALDANYRKNA